MKDNTKQILKVSICTIIALALFVGVILMCIYFAFYNTNDGVADAYYIDEEVGTSNLEFTVDEGFYIKNIWNEDDDYYERLINYYFYFIPDLMDSNTSFYYNFVVGRLYVGYTRNTGSITTNTRTVDLYLQLSKDANSNIIDFDVYISVNYDLYFFEFDYNIVERYLDDFIVNIFGTEYDNYFYINFLDSPSTENTFSNQLAFEIFDDAVDDIISIDSLRFKFYNVANLGCFISPNTTFASPPVVMPNLVYENNLQDEYDRGVASQEQTIEELRNDLAYYESLNLNLSTIEVFNPALMKSSTFVYDGVTYTSNSIVSTDDGWDVYSATYNNEQLPPNYGVGFSLFLSQSITNTKFYVYGDITGWYNYTYCSEPDEQGNQQCYQVSDMISTISVGYRNQNGNIVKVGTFTSNLPGTGGVDFFIDSPTNEIVFFVENCNLMEVDRNTQVIYYYLDTEYIYNDGYENGKSQGIKIGREEGYYQGVADANDYSFFSLFTSVFDAPITAIVGKWGDSDGDGVYQREGGMLNFYIPGLDINFAPFLLSLFTIAIIILVIRFVMARKS